MFFVLSKTISLFLLPSNFFVLCIVAGLALRLSRWRRLGTWLAGGALALLLVFGYSPLSRILLHVLEYRFPRWEAAQGAPDGIIVLGGVLSPGRAAAGGEPFVSEDAARLFAIGKLARAYPDARIVYTSGDATVGATSVPEARLLGPILDAMGVPRARVALESRARNTYENALYSKALVDPKPGERWVLVTTAWHMPRAVGCFRKAGFDVEAYPVNWRTRRGLPYQIFDALSSGLRLTDVVVHEWIGLTAYWVTGRTSEFLPGPRRPG